jgi:hypothetical protein
VIEFRGRIPSTKNRYTPSKGGKGFFKDPTLQAELDRIALQIPGWARDMKLESPEIHVHLKYTKATYDRTNVWQALEDLLVKYGCLSNDNIKRANGMVTIHPAESSEYDGATVILIPRAADAPEAAPRYVDPRRERLRKRVTPQPAPPPLLAAGFTAPPTCRVNLLELVPPPVLDEENDVELAGIWSDL